MKRIITLLLISISIQVYGQIQPTLPKRSPLPQMVQDSAWTAGQILLPVRNSPSLGNYADRPGQSFSFDKILKQLQIRGVNEWIKFPNTGQVTQQIKDSLLNIYTKIKVDSILNANYYSKTVSDSRFIRNDTTKQTGNFSISGTGRLRGDLYVGSYIDTVIADPPLGVSLPTFMVARNINWSAINFDNIRDLSVVNPIDALTKVNSFDTSLELRGAFDFDHVSGYQERFVHNGTGVIDQMWGFYSRPVLNGPVKYRMGVNIQNPGGTGAVENNYGIYVTNQTKGTAFNWGLYLNTTSNRSYLGGPAGFGTENVAGNRIAIAAGTTIIAPIQFFTGNLISTPKIGALEFNTDRLYFTKTTGITREQLAYVSDVSLKQNLVTLTTTGTGAATFNQTTGVLNIPTPSGGSGTVTSITPGIGFNSPTPITTIGTLNLDTVTAVTGIARKGFVINYANSLDANNVKLTGNQTIAGVKTFNSIVNLESGASFNSGTSARFYNAANTFFTNILPTSITNNRSITLPDASGVIALTSDLINKANLSGGNQFSGTQRHDTGVSLFGFTTDQSGDLIQNAGEVYASGFRAFNASGAIVSVRTEVGAGSQYIQYLQRKAGTIALTTDIPSFENYTASGDGSSTTITIAHGLSGISGTSKVIVQPLNSASAGVIYSSIGTTNISIVYTVAPVLGSSNLNYSILIKP